MRDWVRPAAAHVEARGAAGRARLLAVVRLVLVGVLRSQVNEVVLACCGVGDSEDSGRGLGPGLGVAGELGGLDRGCRIECVDLPGDGIAAFRGGELAPLGDDSR